MIATIDQEGCIGCELCATVCPEVFKIGDKGLAEVISDEVPKEVVDTAKEARDGCPVEVISLDEV